MRLCITLTTFKVILCTWLERIYHGKKMYHCFPIKQQNGTKNTIVPLFAVKLIALVA